MKHRYLELDMIRALGIIWIVGFWHMSDYVGYTINGFFASYFTESIMAAFFFLSGLLLNEHKSIITRKDKGNYISRRIQGFIIPFAISVITLLPLQWFTSVKQAILTITGLSAFFPPMAGTLWFSSILILYYIFGFFFLSITDERIKKLLSVVLIGIILIYILFFDNAFRTDWRLITFAPIYIISLNIKPDILIHLQKRHRLFIIVICLVVISIVCICKNTCIKRTVGYISFVFLMLMLSIQIMSMQLMKKKRVIPSVIGKIGIASSFAYFFHRQYFIILRGVYKRLMGNDVINPCLAYCFILPVFFVICYYFSILYSRIKKTLSDNATK